MNCYNLSLEEREYRKNIAEHARSMILSNMQIEAQDETSVMLEYRGYYMQISFSALHPLIVICLAKAIEHPSAAKQKYQTNELNLHSVLGSHAINDEVGCYSYRMTHWLDAELAPNRFFEILDRCIDEATRGYLRLVG